MHSASMKHDNSEIRLVVFDLGRVLIRICNGWTEAARRAQIEAPWKELDPAASAALHEIACQGEIGKQSAPRVHSGDYSRFCCYISR